MAALFVVVGCGPRAARPADWTAGLQSLDGVRFHLEPGDLRVVVVVWSAWSPPCTLLLKELPTLAGRADLVTVLVDSREPAREALLAGGLVVLVPADDSVLDHLRVEVVPTTLVFDRQGRETARFEGYGPDLVAAVGAALKEN